ncbi:MAG: UDP-N-acetylmuramoyl-L-alanyl-D-glutamate--2,6-diaminopimelate ligase [endosymbiont of Galathealinum brachiosum]|uniref:UDP-N-acetylmuramoyl-L-alanyl-D-glutamate--2,6-diaminopimelate ligase n=1 Tax=endosymbiont of Galathealinum brachiosum TaxID=2200906 RepID=A0A370D8W8_9GAMM|nr:MAG: UDP-N-acetylmuramoyl-L-alanyl-D-glutamate--2,6-diaminopimelate ligase [endosymbiont of Galathealinum brachiosum]
MMAALKNNHSAITLKQLLSGLSVSDYLPELEVKGLALDSRKVEQGYVFVALEGQFDHGLAYAEAAISRGAVAVLCDAKFDQYCQQILSKLMSRAICVPVRDLQNKLGEMAGKFYGEPSEKIFVCGVTGTDGKTSVSHFIAQAMNQAYGSAAVVGTLGNGLINNLQESSHTTPDVISLHQMMSDFCLRGVEHVAMEVSSHGLDQKRSAGIDFDVAVLTNLSRDHLDYHGDVESYKQAKKKLFTESNEKALVLNIDDSFGAELYAERKNINPIWLYGLDEKRVKQSKLYVYATGIQNEMNGISFMLKSSEGASQVSIKLIGEFNVYNALACFCVLLENGINFNHAIKYIENLHTVPGRMELFVNENKPSVVIDYAHTPEALSQALINVRKHVAGKVICVFGCGGDRDTGKRPLMAQAAEKLSDLVIITNDNPRTESPEKIIDDIKQGIINELKLIVELDREKAIQHAIEMATSDDLVLIAGKGHELYQVIGNEKIAFSDRKIALLTLGVHQ